MAGPLARRIATYKIGAFFLSSCGFALAPVVAATAEVPFMAVPSSPRQISSVLIIVTLIAFLPLVGYHYLTRKYVLSMHLYIPPQARKDLRTFTTYVNSLKQGTIVRFRTFRLIFGIKSTIVPIEELNLVTVPGKIQAFEKNVEWNSKSIRSRTIWGGRKAWYVQPGLGGQEMDVFWKRIGMEEGVIKEKREKAIASMKEMARKKREDMEDAVKKYESGSNEIRGGRKKSVKKISMK